MPHAEVNALKLHIYVEYPNSFKNKNTHHDIHDFLMRIHNGFLMIARYLLLLEPM